MCGLIGAVIPDWSPDRLRHFCQEGLDTLAHRGPDGAGVTGDDGWILGHRRLSIIDLASGGQPMTNKKHNVSITFNGEIVNYRQLRRELIGYGLDFKTESDTEVVLNAYIVWGSDCLSHFDGMYAFAIYSEKTNTLFCARDPLGIKPLFTTQIDGGVAFASEIRALYAGGEINFRPADQNFVEFLVYGDVSGSGTLHKGIDELPAGHCAHFHDETWTVERFWYPSSSAAIANRSESVLVGELSERIETTVKNWTVSDVPIAAFLSGGVDSGLVSTFAASQLMDLTLLTAYFPEYDYPDERRLAAMVAEQTQSTHIEMAVHSDAIGESLTELVEVFGDPLHDSNSMTYMFLCRALREASDAKVVLTGDGADELFAGYVRHHQIATAYTQSPDPELIMLAKNKIAFERLQLFCSDLEIVNQTREEAARGLRSSDPLGKVLEMDQLFFLPAYLRRQDHIAMQFGLEARPPFLDHHLVEYINALPTKSFYRYRDGVHWRKYLLRCVAERHLPKRLVWNPVEVQFSLPADRMFDEGGPLRSLALDLLTKDAKLGNWYVPAGMLELLDRHDSTTQATNHTNTLFRLLTLEIWLRSMSGASAS